MPVKLLNVDEVRLATMQKIVSLSKDKTLLEWALSEYKILDQKDFDQNSKAFEEIWKWKSPNIHAQILYSISEVVVEVDDGHSQLTIKLMGMVKSGNLVFDYNVFEETTKQRIKQIEDDVKSSNEDLRGLTQRVAKYNHHAKFFNDAERDMGSLVLAL